MSSVKCYIVLVQSEKYIVTMSGSQYRKIVKRQISKRRYSHNI
jgi:hypothetical protein